MSREEEEERIGKREEKSDGPAGHSFHVRQDRGSGSTALGSFGAWFTMI